MRQQPYIITLAVISSEIDIESKQHVYIPTYKHVFYDNN